jgi:hypothetical protein
MSRSVRRTSWVLLWLMLALLPLRGWANLTMHLPATDTPVMAPCHGEASPAAADPAGEACTLCDVCHGAVLLAVDLAPPGHDRRAQTLPAAAPQPAPAAEPDALFRPPRR